MTLPRPVAAQTHRCESVPETSEALIVAPVMVADWTPPLLVIRAIRVIRGFPKIFENFARRIPEKDIEMKHDSYL
jgi:hypothetical protein